MKVFAMLMLLSSLLQNRTLATLEELAALSSKGLKSKFMYLWELSLNQISYCDTNSSGWLLAQAENPAQNQKEFVENIENFIANTKLSILENELSAKIAEFEEQQPHIDGDGFIEFSRNFKVEWKLIEQKIGQANSFDLAKKEDYSKRLDDLAESAMEKTAPLKGIITKKLDELITKCHNDKLNAMKQIINDIGMFDGAANKLLVDNAGFSCAKLKEAVEVDKKMVSTAYQVKDKIYTDDEMMDVTPPKNCLITSPII